MADPQREKKARKVKLLTSHSRLSSPLILKVMDKLAKITKLKEEVAGGKQLEKNQLEMISKEKELTEELKMLQL